MHKTCSKEFWKTVWSNDHNALNILAETIETKPKHTPFAIKIKSRPEKKKKTFKHDAKQYSRVLETHGNDLNALWKVQSKGTQPTTNNWQHKGLKEATIVKLQDKRGFLKELMYFKLKKYINKIFPSFPHHTPHRAWLPTTILMNV